MRFGLRAMARSKASAAASGWPIKHERLAEIISGQGARGEAFFGLAKGVGRGRVAPALGFKKPDDHQGRAVLGVVGGPLAVLADQLSNVPRST